MLPQGSLVSRVDGHRACVAGEGK